MTCGSIRHELIEFLALNVHAIPARLCLDSLVQGSSEFFFFQEEIKW
jgi:hypothetical protein